MHVDHMLHFMIYLGTGLSLYILGYPSNIVLVEVSPLIPRSRGTLFAPVKSDVTGNVTKLQGWYDKDPSKDTLEKLLQTEIEQNTTQAAGSATDALLWLKRGLWMMAKFMQSMLNGERDASKSFTAAYDTTLKPHHNWFVQKAFTVGLKMVPDFQGFLDAMTGPEFKGDKSYSVKWANISTKACIKFCCKSINFIPIRI